MKKKIATIRINDLRLKAIIGTKDSERKQRQEIIINVEFQYDATKAIETDNLVNAVDYEAITNDIKKEVEASQFFLIEKLADLILTIIMRNTVINKTKVRIDKPDAIPLVKSISTELTSKI